MEDHSDPRIDGGSSGNLDSTREWVSIEALTKWTYFLLGCVTLLPFGALTTGTPFFLTRLVNSPFYSSFPSYWSSVYSLTKLFTFIYCTLTLKQSSTSRRIFVSIVATTILVTSLCLSTFVQGTPSTFFLFALFNSACVGSLASSLATALYARAALLGSSFLQSVLSGQGGIGVATAFVQVISAMISLWGLSWGSSITASVADDKDYRAEEMAARIFFGISTLFLCITLAAYTWLTRQHSYKVAITAVKQRQDTETADELTGLITNDHRRIPIRANSRIHHVFKKNWVLMFSIAYSYAVTLAIYPAITTRVRPVNRDIPPLLFTSIHVLAVTAGDFIGRQTCLLPRLTISSDVNILAMSLLRTLFIPLILLCNVYRPVETLTVSPIINSDILFMIILLAIGYTFGFVSCSALLLVSSVERNPKLEGRRDDVDVAATLGGVFMMVGLAVGSLCSFYVQAFV